VSDAYSINNHGDIIGLAQEYDPQPGKSVETLRPTVWHRDGTIQKIGNYYYGGAGVNVNYNINDNMIVTYNIDPPTSDDFYIEDLNTSNSRASIPYDPHDLNNLGQVVYRNYGDPQGAFIRNYDGSKTYLGGQCLPWAINDSMQVVGIIIGTGTISSSGFYWANGVFTELGYMRPQDINNQGVVVGGNAFSGMASMWDITTGEIELSGLNWANAINEHNQVVGYSTVNQSCHASLWDNGVTIDLNKYLTDATWDYLAEARDINDSGQIIGYGYINGDQRAFLMTPVSIPEPATLLLFAFGAFISLRKKS
jgi:probable HAF family extracellular repeat protein